MSRGREPTTSPEPLVQGVPQIGRAVVTGSPVPYVRAVLRSARDPSTYDPRRNPAVWIGLVFAAPIPLAAWLLSAPPWVTGLAFAGLVAIVVVVAAVGRLRGPLEADPAALHRGMTAAANRFRKEAARLAGKGLLGRRRSKDRTASHRIVETELLEAQVFHRGLVPRDIVAPGVEVRLRTIPSTFLGGDYLRASLIRPNCLYLCVGDVSGHGIAAALIVSRIHGLVRVLIHEDLPPERLIEEVNRQLSRLLRDTYHFMTLAVFRIDLDRRTINYATAGHPAPLLLHAGGGSEELSTPNRLLGMDDAVLDETSPAGSASFSPGDTLVLFTDGLFEIRADEGGLLLGYEALRTKLSALSDLPPSDIIEAIFQQVTSYQGSSGFSDDVSLLVARFTDDAQTQPSGEPTTVAVSAHRPESRCPVRPTT